MARIVNNDEETQFLCRRMIALRHTAMLLFGFLLACCTALEFAGVVDAVNGEGVLLVFDMDSEESEEGQEEEREGPEEKKDKTAEYEAFLNADRARVAAAALLLYQVPPPGCWSALVAAKIWEPPELG